jgi:bifunctional DNA-binding transcriptional regulator/antitoxin component of YhaV-PrlF toxin-antitoxin module
MSETKVGHSQALCFQHGEFLFPERCRGHRGRVKLVDMDGISLTVDNQGRIMLPSWWRRENHVGPQTESCVFVTDSGALALETRAQGIARAQQLVRKYIPEGVSLVDELIQDRREEAEREWGK